MHWLDAFNELRKRSGLSLDEISHKSGVPKGTLSKITSGITKNPSIETMKTLVHAIGYTLDDLDPKEQNQSQIVRADELLRIKKYRTLDEYGKKVVDLVLDAEAERTAQQCQPAINDDYDLAAARDLGYIKIPKTKKSVEIPEEDTIDDDL